MKKLISILIILLLTPIAIAEDVTQENVGTLPDSPMYGLKIAMEKINLALTFDSSTKAEKRLLQAQKRLQEVEIMVEQNKLQAAEKAQKNYQKLLQKLEVIETTDPEKAAKLQEKIEAHEQKLEQVKAKIQQKIETKQENKAQLEEMIGKIIEESSLAREQAIESITKNIEKLQAANKSGNAVQALTKVKEKLESKQLLGETCITVSPDSVNECCIKKGYEKWDSEKAKCTGEKIREKKQAKIREKPKKEEDSGELTITNVENKATEGTAIAETQKMRNTLLQTKNIMYDIDKLIREVWNEGLDSKRSIFVDIQEGDFLIDDINDKISWNVISKDNLGIKPSTETKEGNLIIKSNSLGQGYNIQLLANYKETNIDIKTTAGTKQLSGAYNLVIEHSSDCGGNDKCILIREA